MNLAQEDALLFQQAARPTQLGAGQLKASRHLARMLRDHHQAMPIAGAELVGEGSSCQTGGQLLKGCGPDPSHFAGQLTARCRGWRGHEQMACQPALGDSVDSLDPVARLERCPEHGHDPLGRPQVPDQAGQAGPRHRPVPVDIAQTALLVFLNLELAPPRLQGLDLITGQAGALQRPPGGGAGGHGRAVRAIAAAVSQQEAENRVAIPAGILQPLEHENSDSLAGQKSPSLEVAFELERLKGGKVQRAHGTGADHGRAHPSPQERGAGGQRDQRRALAGFQGHGSPFQVERLGDARGQGAAGEAAGLVHQSRELAQKCLPVALSERLAGGRLKALGGQDLLQDLVHLGQTQTG